MIAVYGFTCLWMCTIAGFALMSIPEADDCWDVALLGAAFWVGMYLALDAGERFAECFRGERSS